MPTGVYKRKTFKDSFSDKYIAEPNSGCWLWLGWLMPNGYGQVRVNQKTILAHRASFMLFIGEIHPGNVIMHSCDNRACVNPDHLSQGPQAENLQDAVKRGRNHFANKTHCPANHEYTTKNTHIGPSGSRFCRECNREAKRRQRVKQ